MITDKKVDAAIEFLADDTLMREIAREARLAAHLVKHIEAREFKLAECAVTAKLYHARATNAYDAACHRDAEAYAAYEAYKGRREAAALVIEVWRSQQANARTGNRIG